MTLYNHETMAANTGARTYHGLSKDKRYWRWMIIHNRCYNKKNQAYSSYGAKGVVVEWEWHKDNPNGLYNFLEWIETKLKEAGNPKKYIVILNDRTKNYGPSNCAISTQQVAIQKREMNQYSAEIVAEMRKFKRENPGLTLEDLVLKYGGSNSNISRALTGVTYSNVDAIEPPIDVATIRQEINLTRRLRREVAEHIYRALQKEVAMLWQDRQQNIEIPVPTFQQRLSNWVLHCFGAKIRSDKRERDVRFLEEAIELVQARGNVGLKDAVAMVHYVYSRPAGEVGQEVGGTVTCLAALVATEQHADGSEMDFMEEGEKELTRIWGCVDKIREKQKLKPH